MTNFESNKLLKQSETFVPEFSDEKISLPKLSLPLWRKITFGFGGFGIGTIRSILGLFQLAFLLEVVQLEAVWAGVILLTEQIFDSFTDPLVGFLSDHYATRFGRRRPWIYVFIIPLFIFWVLSWLSPGHLLNQEAKQVSYYLAIFMCFSFCATCVIVPYQAIIPDVAPDSYERTSVVMLWQVFFVMGATTSSYIWSASLLFFPENDNPDELGMPANYRLGYIVASVLSGIGIVASIILGVQFVAETEASTPSEPILQKFKKFSTILKFPPFIIVALMNCFSMMSISLFISNVYLYFKYVLLEESESGFYFLALQSATLLSLIFWFFLSFKVKKHTLFIFGSSLEILVLLSFFALPEYKHKLPIYLTLVLRGLTVGPAYLFPFAIVPDVISYYYAIHKEKQEASFYSLMNFTEKMGLAFSFLLSSVLLGMFDYRNPYQQAEDDETQSDSANLILRCLVSVIPSLFALLAILLGIIFYFKVYKSKDYFEIELASDSDFD